MRFASCALGDWRFAAIVEDPGTIVGMGRNYRAHVADGVHEISDYPVLFSTLTETLVPAGEPIVIPPESSAVDYEAELALAVGRPVRRAARETPLEVVGGHAAANDVPMRDYQYRSNQWLQGEELGELDAAGARCS